jgi:hypothetical protein
LSYREIADKFNSYTNGKYDVACMPKARKSREGSKPTKEQQCAIGVTERIMTVSVI